MAKAQGYALRLAPQRLRLLAEHLTFSETFAEPVPDFRHARGLPLVCFVGDTEGNTHFLAMGAKGRRAGTDLTRLNLSSFERLRPSVRLESFVPDVPPTIRRHLASTIEGGGLLTERQFLALVDAVVARGEGLADLLARYSSLRDQRIAELSEGVVEQLAFQKEAMSTALLIAGLDRSPLRDWAPPNSGLPLSFLDGLDQVRLREDAAIAHDMAIVPGFEAVRHHVSGSTVFHGPGGTTLTIVLANRQPLEELTGTDLIYYNESFGAFVMVQYKMMDHNGAGGAIFRLPNAQLDNEVSRMEEILKSIEGKAGVDDPNGFRLSWNPFYLKLCPRLVFNPDSTALTPGMYVPFEKWKLVADAPGTVGPRGGRGVTYANTGRHLDNTTFAALVGKAWIGTSPGQSEALVVAIRETIAQGKAVVVAVQS